MSQELVLTLYLSGLVVAALIVGIALVLAARIIAASIRRATDQEIEAFAGPQQRPEPSRGAQASPQGR